MDNEECIHGLEPSTCSLCRAKLAPKVARPVPTARPTTPRASSVRTASARPKAARPSTRANPVHLAGRKEFFGADVRGVWWIDQTGRADDEWAEGVVAAERPTTGTVPASARNVGEIRIGDLTLHIVAGKVVAVGVAIGHGRATTRPAGWLAEVEIEPLTTPIEVADLPAAMRPGPPHPFTNQGFVQPGICYPFPPAVAAKLATRFGDRFPPQHPLVGDHPSS